MPYRKVAGAAPAQSRTVTAVLCKFAHLAQTKAARYLRPTSARRERLRPEFHHQLSLDGETMKTILLMTAVLVLAGCGEKKGTTSGADTSGMAPAIADSSSMMHSDSTMMRDTTK